MTGSKNSVKNYCSVALNVNLQVKLRFYGLLKPLYAAFTLGNPTNKCVIYRPERNLENLLLWFTPASNRKIYCDLNGNELEKYAWIYANIELQKQPFTDYGMTALQILENSQESNHGGVLSQ